MRHERALEGIRTFLYRHLLEPAKQLWPHSWHKISCVETCDASLYAIVKNFLNKRQLRLRKTMYITVSSPQGKTIVQVIRFKSQALTHLNEELIVCRLQQCASGMNATILEQLDGQECMQRILTRITLAYQQLQNDLTAKDSDHGSSH